MEGFSASFILRIDWSETDIFGHINNLAILRYAQTARVKLMEDVGLMQLFHEVRKGPTLASIKCQFIKPLFYPGEITVHSRVELIKRTSFELVHNICNEKNETTARVNEIIVYFDFINKTKLPLPDNIRSKIEDLKVHGTQLNEPGS
jgi:acyl-CoA thioester hydrolase